MQFGTTLFIVAVFGLASSLGADFATGLSAYEKGDYATALKEWEPLARDGGAAAQYNVGLLYYNGRGVPQDFKEAASWFERAANQGYVKAEHNLGAMYGTGQGVKRDYMEAYKWLSICAAAGDQSCESQRDLVAEKLKGSRLRGSRLETAQRMAREWKPVLEKKPEK